MKYFIITGTSSGLGEALAKCVIEEQHKVFCISRRMNNSLKELASQNKTLLWYYEHDLNELNSIHVLMDEIFSCIDPEVAGEITLINNAGVVEPVKFLGNHSTEEITAHISINLTAPFILSNEFISKCERFHCKKNIINISSGAAHNAYAGWTLYCSTKAALDMLTRTIGLEQKNKDFPVRALSIAPGIVNTKMQEKLREATVKDFPMKQKFEELHQQNRLTAPGAAATGILQMVSDYTIKGGSIVDLRKATTK